MRYAYMVLVVLFTAAVLLFKVQNLETVTVAFLSIRLTLPVALLVVLVYVLGMMTGGFLVNLVTGWVRGARRPQRG